MSITSQPFATNAPVVAFHDRNNEKACSHEDHGHQYAQLHDSEARRCRCSRARSRRIAITILLAAFSILALLLVSCLWDAAFNEGSWLNALGFADDSSESAWMTIGSLVKRQSDGTSGSGGNTFVHNKLYLIVVFVGLVLVVLAAICLSAWCCRGAFENPLCCPCYVCAWCGGLACLECIGCGLCAEGIDQM
ncbi:hypothetical protein BD309DRAFT_963935 [Dichomitus squalens]|uniref:Transmembrane protein n=1 Tax=Dichomitus squalens TaxID=114155 RepID=A0A4Q9MGJ7_9APHY|nr:hypothetical protein BD311DRAFT_790504 [Dichomitus squalens]TBU42042.1 hypothetical protein BD309DRAFT_963935 [Dichomitus squalens]TBU52706.1 hypothetical protein BD310DRAFT_939681 [Dichomitus squalens]